jgi:hypothetical protein
MWGGAFRWKEPAFASSPAVRLKVNTILRWKQGGGDCDVPNGELRQGCWTRQASWISGKRRKTTGAGGVGVEAYRWQGIINLRGGRALTALGGRVDNAALARRRGWGEEEEEWVGASKFSAFREPARQNFTPARYEIFNFAITFTPRVGNVLQDCHPSLSFTPFTFVRLTFPIIKVLSTLMVSILSLAKRNVTL